MMEVDLGGLDLAEVTTGALQEGDLLQGQPLEHFQCFFCTDSCFMF